MPFSFILRGDYRGCSRAPQERFRSHHVRPAHVDSRYDSGDGTAVAIREEERASSDADLKWRGYKIIARNFRAAGAEIDVIAVDHGTIVFVEVKARMSDALGPPELAVDDRKQFRIRRAAAIFANRSHREDRQTRFDVIAIVGDGRGCKLEHLKDAF
jgi:putative endonuclease